MGRKFRITVNGLSYEVEVEEVSEGAPPERPPVRPSPPPPPKAPAEAPRPAVGGEGFRVTAPLPGAVLDIRVKVGEEVREGQVLVILEAMKMENEIIAPRAGVVNEVAVARGASVNLGDVLVVIG